MKKYDVLFLFVLATIPIQLGRFFWPDFAYVLGIPIDYLAPSIYFTDLVIILYLIVFLPAFIKNFEKIYSKRADLIITIVALNLYLIFSAIFVTKSQSSVYSSLKVLEFSTLALFAAVSFDRAGVRKNLGTVLKFTLIWQVTIIFLQALFQKSLGLWFLGERTFDAATVGIAHAEILGRQILRPYGTFSHPNVAAAFLTISLILVPRGKFARTAAVAGILLTFSKTAIFSLVIIFLTLISKIKYLILALTALLFGLIFVLTSLPQSQIATISERLLLGQVALDLTLKNVFFGVGSANFIPELSKLDLFSQAEIRLLQPVHNVFLLILAENGLVGFLLFTILMIIVLRSAKTKIKIALYLTVLIFASFDHFFWTLQQGRLLFWLAIGLIVSDTLGKEHAQKSLL